MRAILKGPTSTKVDNVKNRYCNFSVGYFSCWSNVYRKFSQVVLIVQAYEFIVDTSTYLPTHVLNPTIDSFNQNTHTIVLDFIGEKNSVFFSLPKGFCRFGLIK